MKPLAPRSRFFDEFFRDFPFGYSIKPLHGDPLPSPDKIKIEVKESGKDVTVNAEIPGVNKEDIHGRGGGRWKAVGLRPQVIW